MSGYQRQCQFCRKWLDALGNQVSGQVPGMPVLLSVCPDCAGRLLHPSSTDNEVQLPSDARLIEPEDLND